MFSYKPAYKSLRLLGAELNLTFKVDAHRDENDLRFHQKGKLKKQVAKYAFYERQTSIRVSQLKTLHDWYKIKSIKMTTTVNGKPGMITKQL